MTKLDELCKENKTINILGIEGIEDKLDLTNAFFVLPMKGAEKPKVAILPICETGRESDMLFDRAQKINSVGDSVLSQHRYTEAEAVYMIGYRALDNAETACYKRIDTEKRQGRPVSTSNIKLLFKISVERLKHDYGNEEKKVKWKDERDGRFEALLQSYGRDLNPATTSFELIPGTEYAIIKEVASAHRTMGLVAEAEKYEKFAKNCLYGQCEKVRNHFGV